jgi:hypothetical protein
MGNVELPVLGSCRRICFRLVEMRISFKDVESYPWPCANPECDALLEAGHRSPIELFDCQLAIGFGYAAAFLCDDCALRITKEAMEFEDLPIENGSSQ